MTTWPRRVPVRGRAAVESLRSPAFRRYVAGQLPSVTCSWAQVVALSWVVVQLDPGALGWVVALQFLPSLLLGPWFGAVADRLDRRLLLVLAEAGLGSVALAYALAAAAGALTMPVVYVLAGLWGVVNALDTPARRALVPMLVPAEHAAGAAALASTVMLLGMTAGSALGGVLVATVGAGVAFAVNAASFLADAVLVLTLRVGPSPRVQRAPHQVRDGVRYVWRTATLRGPMLALAVIGTFAFTFQVSVPILITEHFHGGPDVIGAAFTLSTAGSLAGALAAAARGTPGPATIGRTAIAMAAAMVGTAVAPTLPLALAGLVVIGIVWSLFLNAVIAVLQTADPRMMGRVMALMGVLLLGGTAVGGPIAATLAAAVDPRAPFVLGAVAAVVARMVERGRTASAFSAGRGRTPAGPRPAAQAAPAPRSARRGACRSSDAGRSGGPPRPACTG